MLKSQSEEICCEDLTRARILLNNTMSEFENDSFQSALDNATEAHKMFLKLDSIADVSICLSFIGLLKYLIEPKAYYKTLSILEDAKFLANSSSEDGAGGINRFAFSQIALKEHNYTEALLYLTRAASMLNDYPYLQVKIYETLAFIHLEEKNFEKAYFFAAQGIELSQRHNFDSCIKRLNSLYKNMQEKSEVIITKSLSCNKPSNAPIEAYDPMIALLKIARTINAEIDLDSLLVTIAEQTKLALNADRCTVFLIDKENNELWSKVALGMDSEEIRFPMGKGLAGHVATSGETVNIKNAYTDERFNKEIDIQTGYKTENILCMPIRNIKYEIIGVFQVLNKHNGDFTNHDEDLLVTIGSSAGIALENNILFNRQQKMLQEQKELFSNFIDTLAASIDARDKITSGHSRRVKMYAEIIARGLDVDEEMIQTISKAALLHDIGKIGIRDSVLQKEGRLTPEEYDHIKTHVELTHDILSKINASKSFQKVVEIASSHHEKFDGSGYFRNLSGKEIPLGGRVLAVADVFDAITSVRHYRDKMPIQNAINILLEGKDAHFDSKVVDTFLHISCDKIVEIFLSESISKFEKEDKNLLSKLCLADLYCYINNPEQTQEENKAIKLFELYYTNKSIIHN